MIREALPEELIEFARTVEIDDEHPTYPSQIEAVLRAALDWRDSDGSPYLYTRDDIARLLDAMPASARSEFLIAQRAAG